MGNLLVFLQHDEGILPKATLSAIGAAAEIKDKWQKENLIGLCLGPASEKAAVQALSYGFDRVLYTAQAVFDRYLAKPFAAAAISACEEQGCDVAVGAATSMVKDFFPRVAAALEAGQGSEVVGINDDGSLRRLMYAGDVLADFEICSQNKVVTIRSTAFSPAEKGRPSGDTIMHHFTVESEGIGEVISYKFSGGERPDLASADCVVSGGSALGSVDKFNEYIFPLADVLGAAVGASRLAVDSGFAPNDWQVGQTGKIIAPQLYIAVGISGAVQHLAGMKDSAIIVAINKNNDAPIFEIADYGLVADLFEVVPELVDEIKKVKTMNP